MPPDPSPEAILDRLHGLHPRLIDLSLDRLLSLLAKLGNPHLSLPPVIHVGGTNGKGSTCAFIRAVAEAAGLRVHVFTSPHLVRFNERIRLAGTLVDDATLAAAFDAVEQTNAAAPITVFEVITAAAFALFARVPADLCVLEVGLGGRGDATNVITHPAACAITSISLDHQELLGDTLGKIAAEKAGIIKPGVPLITGRQPPEALTAIASRAAACGAPVLRRDRDWTISGTPAEPRFEMAGTAPIHLAPLALPGLHQMDNAGIALAALYAAALPIVPAAFATGLAQAEWPARLQRLHGALAAMLPPGWELWLDGGHNQGAATALAETLSGWADRPLHLLVGMKQTKNPREFLSPLRPHATSLWAIEEPGQHQALPVAAIIAAAQGGVHGGARPGPTLRPALRQLAGPPARVLICGSLYLAGEALKLDAAA